MQRQFNTTAATVSHFTGHEATLKALGLYDAGIAAGLAVAHLQHAVEVLEARVHTRRAAELEARHAALSGAAQHRPPIPPPPIPHAIAARRALGAGGEEVANG